MVASLLTTDRPSMPEAPRMSIFRGELISFDIVRYFGTSPDVTGSAWLSCESTSVSEGDVGLSERFVEKVFRREYGPVKRKWPVDCKGWVVKPYSTFRLWRVEVIALVLEYSRVRQHGKPMSEALWDEQLPMVVSRKLHRHMLPESGTSFADVYCHVEYSAHYDTYEFTLCVRWTLKVETTYDTPRRHALIVLHKSYGVHLFIELTLRERLKEVPSGITEDARLDDDHAIDIGTDGFHLYVVGVIGQVEKILAVLVIPHGFCLLHKLVT